MTVGGALRSLLSGMPETVGTTSERIPVLLCVDVEPDGRFFPPSRPSPWHGFERLVPWMERYRERLEDLTGERARFSWFLRMDPQVAVAYGSPEHVVHAHARAFEALLDRGDALGLHPHMVRWDGARDRWVVDHGDPAWVRTCLEVAFAAYRSAFGRPARHHRFGSGWWSEEALGEAERLGARFDLTAEPGERTGALPSRGVTWTGEFPDFGPVPQEPYRPDPSDARRPAPASARALWEIPMTSGRFVGPRGMRRWAGALRHPARSIRRLGARLGPRAAPGPDAPVRPRLLAMWREWRSPADFWASAEERLREIRLPYLVFTVRSEWPIVPALRARIEPILEHLLVHPLGRRLVFTTPDDLVRRLGLEGDDRGGRGSTSGSRLR
jgi:hypothetical protein